MNVCFETFGCRLNRAEALEAEAQAVALGHKIVKTHSHADIFVVRGCSVTARAQRECEQTIERLKRHYPNKRIIVTGCLAGAEKGLGKQVEGGRLGKQVEGGRLKVEGGRLEVEQRTAPIPMRTARAYLKVQDGCAGNCAFCIVPKFRGTARSEDFDATVDKAKRFIDAGYHEIVVTGCNLALFASSGKRLPDLLAALAELDANCRIRLGSLEPWGCADEVVDAMAEHENICRFLHIPVQSGSDRILKLMNRPYASTDVARIVKKARGLMPAISIGCDLMTGFPGESEGDFAFTRNLMTRLAISNAHIFPFSERPGTPAAKMPGHIQRQVRSDRAHILSGVAKANRKRFAQAFIGKEVTVLVESHGEQPKGWTGEYLWFEGPVRPVLSEKNVSHRRELMRFIVKSADNDTLHGVAVGHGR